MNIMKQQMSSYHKRQGDTGEALPHRPDFWPAAHVVGRKNIYLASYLS